MTRTFTRFSPFPLALLMAACATTSTPPTAPPPTQAPPAQAAPPKPDQGAVDAKRRAEFDKAQASWHGAKTQELVAKLGPPTTSAKQANGSPMYVYSRTAKLNGPTGPISFSCVVRYLLDGRGDRVVGHQIDGC